jgi:hypothetical protein
MTKDFWLISLVCVSMLFVAAFWQRIQVFDRKRLPAVIGFTLILGVITSSLVFVSSYAYYINDWAPLGVIPLDAIVGIPVLIMAFSLFQKRVLYWPLLCLLPIGWFCAWNFLSRPDGIWVRAHSANAYTSFFVPDDAKGVTRTNPRRYQGAIFEMEYFSEMTFDDLTRFCTNHIRQAGFQLVEVREFPQQDGAYYPMWIIYYRNRSGQVCIAHICDNPPYRERNRYRRVTFQCLFDGALINPPVFVL